MAGLVNLPGHMDFDLSSDQEALRDAARDLLDGRCDRATVRASLDEPGFDRELWAAMVEQGWLGVATPERSGGLGLGLVEAAILLEQTGAHLAPVPFRQQLLALSVLGSTPWGRSLVDGSAIGTASFRPLRRHGDGSVSGRTEPVLFGAAATMLVAPAVAADAGPDDPPDTLLAIDLTEVERAPEPAMDLTRELAWIELDREPAIKLGDAAAADQLVDRAATFASAEMLGGAAAILDDTVAYAKEREQFGRPIGSFQAVKHRCADMLVDVEGMRSATYYAAWATGSGDPDASVAASTAKVWCSDAGLRVAESALQVHGGIGFTWEADVHLFLKRAQLDQVNFGDATWHRDRLARLLRERLAAGQSII